MDNNFEIKAYYKNELARLYGISRFMLIKWITKIPDLHLEERQKILTPTQVKKIVNHLGQP